jgi:hypothetical protein
VTSGGSENRVINSPKRRTANLTAQEIELTTEDRQLDVPEVGAASAADEQTEQSSKGQLGNEKHMTPDPPKPARGRPE